MPSLLTSRAHCIMLGMRMLPSSISQMATLSTTSFAAAAAAAAALTVVSAAESCDVHPSQDGNSLQQATSHSQTANARESAANKPWGVLPFPTLPTWTTANLSSVFMGTCLCDASHQSQQQARPVGVRGLSQLPRTLMTPFPMTPEEKASGVGGDISRLLRWLEAAGATLNGLKILPSPGAGLTLHTGVAVKSSGMGGRMLRWLSGFSSSVEAVLASFPAATTLNVATISLQPITGPVIKEAFMKGVVDERLAVVVFLMLERQKGERSPWAPYINLLPREFSTPIFFTEAEMAELRGTHLEAAAGDKS